MTWLRLIWRDIRFNPLLWTLSLLGIAVGVAGWVGMEGATGRASRAFDRSMSTTFGKATHVIENRVGTLDESVYFKLGGNTGLDMSPLIEDYGRTSAGSDNSQSSQYVRLLGIDPLSYGQFQERVARHEVPFDEFLAGADVVVLSADFRKRYKKGDSFVVSVEDETFGARVMGFIDDESLRGTAMFDIGWLQKKLGESGSISRVLVRDENRPLDFIRQWLPETSVLLPTGTRTRSVRSMVGAFQWNLRALSFLSLFVGAFLVYSTMYLYTARQVNLISLLKTIGVSRGEVMVVLFGGLAVMGTVGSILGVALGTLFSIPMGELVGRTVNSLYEPLFAGADYISWYHLVGGVGLGLTMSFVGGFKPILNNLGVTPRAWERSEIEVGRPLRDRLILAMVGGFLWGSALLVVSFIGHVLAGFFACFLIAFGGSLISPLVLDGLSRVKTKGVWLTMAFRNVRFYGSRTGVMVAVLVAAFSMVLAVSLMVNSFRDSVDQWINNVIKADYYVRSAPGSNNKSKPPLDPSFLEKLRDMDEISGVGVLAEKTFLSPDGDPITLRGIEPDVLRDQLNYQFNEHTGAPWRSLKQGEVWLSEPGSYRMGKRSGDRLKIPTSGSNNVSATVAAIYNDYSTEWAVVYMSLDRMRRLFDDVTMTSAAVFTKAENVDQQLRELTEPYGYFVESQRTLKRRALKEFDRTFAVTDVMKLVAAVVAGVGLLILLISFTQARFTIFGRLSAMGSSREQLAGMIVGESLLITVAAFTVSVPTGLYLSNVLITVINRRSFGWLIPFSVDPGPFLNLTWLMSLALVVSVSVPVYRLWTVPLDKLLRDESA